MGACCCRPKSPCGSVEERSGLLKDDVKPPGSAGQVAATVEGTCGPQDDDDIKKAMDDNTLAVDDMEVVETAIAPEFADPKTILPEVNGTLHKEAVEASPESSDKVATFVEKDTGDENKMTVTDEKTLSEVLQQEVNSQREAGDVGSLLTAEVVTQNDGTRKIQISPRKSVPEVCPQDGDDGAKMAENHSLVRELLNSNKEAFSPDTQEASVNATFQEKLQPDCLSLVNNNSDDGVPSAPQEEKSHKTRADPTEAALGGEEQRPDDVDVLTAMPENTSSPHAATESQQENMDQHAGGDPRGGQPEDVPIVVDEDKMAESDPEESEDRVREAPLMLVEEVILKSSQEDLDGGAAELPSPQEEPLEMDARSSLGPVVNIMSYSQKEWRGNTAKSRVIREGYSMMSQWYSGVRQVRGDNYCALRATLFQVLSQATQVPDWLEEDDPESDQTSIAMSELMGEWTFPGEDGAQAGVAERLQSYLEILRNKWSEAARCPSPAERQRFVDDAFRGGEGEMAMLEALKLLMMRRASRLHADMRAGRDVPLFCWLLFARDSSHCPRAFLANHLSRVGVGAGVEQVEMCLLGWALRRTLQVYRLYKANTEEFVAFYPDEHKDEWPRVSLVTEDDRHYNVPVAHPPKDRPASS
ncbi:uncharacterized protein LOC144091519 [Stigmatopora argus]